MLWIYLLLVIILAIIVIIIYVLALKIPGVFMDLKRNDKWFSEEIGRAFLTNSSLYDVQQRLERLPTRKLSSVLSVVGTAAYIDSSAKSASLGPGGQYCLKAKESNKYLEENFGTLYRDLLSHLESRLPADEFGACKCQYAKEHNISLPGFHIFSGKSVLGRGWAVASLHVDLQELSVPWPKGYEFDMSKTYSFTIPISVTPDSGLYIFKKKADNINMIIPLCLTLRNVPRQKIYYKNGDCYLHHGKWFHLISPFKGRKIAKNKYSNRITMQGHCIYCITTKSYWIYW